GKGICLVRDNDAAGAKYESTACASLNGKANSLRVVSVAPYHDFRRWADGGGTAEQILRLWEAAPEWTPGDGGGGLDAVMRFVRRFVCLTDTQARVVALWVLHSYSFDAALCTPYLAINSAEKQSGKTRLLEVLRLLVANPWFTGRATAAVLVRRIDAECPT